MWCLVNESIEEAKLASSACGSNWGRSRSQRESLRTVFEQANTNSFDDFTTLVIRKTWPRGCFFIDSSYASMTADCS